MHSSRQAQQATDPARPKEPAHTPTKIAEKHSAQPFAPRQLHVTRQAPARLVGEKKPAKPRPHGAEPAYSERQEERPMQHQKIFRERQMQCAPVRKACPNQDATP